MCLLILFTYFSQRCVPHSCLVTFSIYQAFMESIKCYKSLYIDFIGCQKAPLNSKHHKIVHMTLKFEYAGRYCTLNGVYSRVARFPFCQQNPPNYFSKLAQLCFFWWRPPGNICIPGDKYHVIWVVTTCGHEKQPVETVGKPWTWQLWSTGFMDRFYDTSVVRSF